MIRNKNNFIRWYDSTVSGTLDRARVKDFDVCNPVPIWKNADTMRIYFNDSLNAAPTGLVDIINSSGITVHANVGTLASYTVVGGNHSYGLMTCPNLPVGIYRFKIGSLTSTPFRIVSSYSSEIATVSFSHNGNMLSGGGSYIYKNLNFTSTFNLPIVAVEFDYDNARDVYEETTTRAIRANNQRTRKYIKFKASYLDDDTIDAFAWMLTHDTISINGQSVEPKSGAFIEKEFDPLEKLNHIYFTMYESSTAIASVS